MIRPFLAGMLLTFVACHGAQTQSTNEPQVVVVPPDELSRPPSMPQATTPATPVDSSTPAPAAEMESPTPATSAPSHHVYNSCNVEGRKIALTFDDGPSAKLTPRLLDMLKERGIKATFFVLGTCVAANPELVKRMVEEGHEVGNHSWDHKSLAGLGAAGLQAQIDRTNAAIENAGGVKPVVIRPPYGATNSSLNKKLDEQYGLKVIMWSVDPLDWKFRNSPRVTAQILENTKPGSIVLAHDIHATTVDAMPATLDGLKDRGFEFVTVSELLALDRPTEVAKQPVR